jgi:hypothetical protein
MALSVFSMSPRTLRRLRWGAAFAGVVGGVAALIAFLPTAAPEREPSSSSGAARVADAPQEVSLTRAQRRAITELVDAFVPAAIERRNLDLAYKLVTPSFRAGVSRAEWYDGSIPVHPFDARAERHYAWRINYAWPSEVSIEVFLQPSRHEKLGPMAFTGLLVPTGDTWKIEEFVTSATFAPEKKAPRILAQPDFQPNMIEGAHTTSRLSADWLLLPLGVLALVPIVPLVFFIRTKRIERRALRNYRSLYERAL